VDSRPFRRTLLVATPSDFRDAPPAKMREFDVEKWDRESPGEAETTCDDSSMPQEWALSRGRQLSSCSLNVVSVEKLLRSDAPGVRTCDLGIKSPAGEAAAERLTPVGAPVRARHARRCIGTRRATALPHNEREARGNRWDDGADCDCALRAQARTRETRTGRPPFQTRQRSTRARALARSLRLSHRLDDQHRRGSPA
jgi:hypothetical protein